MVESKDLPIDVTKDSPGQLLSTFTTGKFWKENLENNDFLLMYRRHGLGRKIIRKFASEMFKKGMILNDKRQEALRKEYLLDDVVQISWTYASVSGFSLVYVGYADVKELNDYATPAPENSVPESFYCIPRAWIKEDIKQKYQNVDKEYYELYQENGGSFKIHKSRIIRYATNREELSLLEPVYNSLQVVDNMLWSAGQAMWRTGQGFPHITIESPKNVKGPGGVIKNELQLLQDSAVLRDINSETGYISDKRVNIDFVGAAGKALNPAEYWDLAIESVAISVDIPKDILRGVSAGAVTGSETNLKEYYSMLHSKQVEDLEPLYTALFERLRISSDSIIFEWLNIFEQNQQEQAQTFLAHAQALNDLTISGVLSSATAANVLYQLHDDLDLSGNKPRENVPQSSFGFGDVTKNKLLRAKRDPELIKKLSSDDWRKITNNLSLSHIKNQHDVSDDEAVDAVIEASGEASALPPKVQKVEGQYLRAMGKQFRATTQNVTNLFEAFNTDVCDADLYDARVPRQKSYIVEPLGDNKTRIREE